MQGSCAAGYGRAQSAFLELARFRRDLDARDVFGGDTDVLICNAGTHIGNFLSPATYCHEDVPLGIDSEQRRLDLAQEERDSLCTLFSCIDG